ncbi:hypothetical protein S7711_09184 [Stachybotrys chartarum IBT 7711]|uniref:Uncharacterized protein n=1 Tax=Stachybotrys chartarum (strain CBS 109288 / IBT 7711) TaxID=1280523 RepID=A0A084ALS9_STACB|nr:hypothetical protein S7711_09184 [Stachybotrys chartarum IBT 7711]
MATPTKPNPASRLIQRKTFGGWTKAAIGRGSTAASSSTPPTNRDPELANISSDVVLPSSEARASPSLRPQPSPMPELRPSLSKSAKIMAAQEAWERRHSMPLNGSSSTASPAAEGASSSDESADLPAVSELAPRKTAAHAGKKPPFSGPSGFPSRTRDGAGKYSNLLRVTQTPVPLPPLSTVPTTMASLSKRSLEEPSSAAADSKRHRASKSPSTAVASSNAPLSSVERTKQREQASKDALAIAQAEAHKQLSSLSLPSPSVASGLASPSLYRRPMTSAELETSIRQEQMHKMQSQTPIAVPSSQPVIDLTSTAAKSSPILQAPDGRRYNSFLGPSGKIETASGVLFPDGYSLRPGYASWACPVSGCYSTHANIKGLAGHFHASHHSKTFQDNRDGSLTEIGPYKNPKGSSPPIITTRLEAPKPPAKPLATHTPPVIQTPVPLPATAHLMRKSDPRDQGMDTATISYMHKLVRFSKAPLSGDTPVMAALEKQRDLPIEWIAFHKDKEIESWNFACAVAYMTGEEVTDVEARCTADCYPTSRLSGKCIKPPSQATGSDRGRRSSSVASASSGSVAPVSARSESKRKKTHPETGLASVESLSVDQALSQITMEEWEFAPGRLESRSGQDTLALSNTYLNGHQAIQLAEDVSCQVVQVKPGRTHTWTAADDRHRSCFLMAGKLNVRMDGHDGKFRIGVGGLLNIMPGRSCTVENAFYMDAALFVNTNDNYTLRDG